MPGVCENGACDNMMGSHRCICNPGYEVDASGKKCQDINECQDELICSGGQCRNSPGSYQVITVNTPHLMVSRVSVGGQKESGWADRRIG